MLEERLRLMFNEESRKILFWFMDGNWSVDFIREIVEQKTVQEKVQYEKYLKEMLENFKHDELYIMFGSYSEWFMSNTLKYLNYCNVIDRDLELEKYIFQIRLATLHQKNYNRHIDDDIHINFLKKI